MATNVSEIYDLFMLAVTDYRLTDLFIMSKEDFEEYLEAWLIFSISDFYVCTQSLVFSKITKDFDVTLTQENIAILALLMAKYWLQKSVNDITQMNLHITDRDFRMASEAQNLREKSNYLNSVKESCSQKLNDYGYSNLDWDEWYAGDFKGD